MPQKNSYLPPTGLTDNTIKGIDNSNHKFTCKWNTSVNCKIFISAAFEKMIPQFSWIMDMQA